MFCKFGLLHALTLPISNKTELNFVLASEMTKFFFGYKASSRLGFQLNQIRYSSGDI
jgi:hypothetical protein